MVYDTYKSILDEMILHIKTLTEEV